MDELASPPELSPDLPLPSLPPQSPNSFGGELIAYNVLDYNDRYVKLNSAYQVAFMESLGTGAFVNSTTYRRVEVLMLSWQTQFDDLKVQDEIANLRKVFEERFNFHITLEYLERNEEQLTQLQMNRILANWVYKYEGHKTLLIVYFAGHGRGSKDGLELCGQLSPSDLRDYLDRVVWNKTEHFLQGLRADILQIFDCCFAGSIENRGHVRGASEFLAATAKDGYTPKPGPRSFTTALIWALNQLAEEKRPFTTSQLSNKIREAPDFPKDQKPLLIKRGERALGGRQMIVLQPLRDAVVHSPNEQAVSETTTPPEHMGTDVMTLKLVFTTRPDESDVRKLGRDLTHVVARNELKVNRIDFVGVYPVQPKRDELVYRALNKFRAIARRKSKGQTEAKVIELVKNIEDDVEGRVLNRIDNRTSSPRDRNTEFTAHTMERRSRTRK